MRTQWRIVPDTPKPAYLGLDYTALYGHPKFARLDYDEQDKLLGQIQHIEAGALSAMNEQSYLAEQEAEQQAKVTEMIQISTDLNYLQEEKQRINVQELMNVMDLPACYRGGGAFVA